MHFFVWVAGGALILLLVFLIVGVLVAVYELFEEIKKVRKAFRKKQNIQT